MVKIRALEMHSSIGMDHRTLALQLSGIAHFALEQLCWGGGPCGGSGGFT